MTPAAAEGRIQATLAELVALRGRLPRRLAAPMDRLHGSRAGSQASVLRGRGMDYRESRAYQPGDDVRRLDWRLTARSGRLHTKLFQEERERRMLVVLDTHASMRFGTRQRFKSVQGARAAACAAWLAVATGMQAGLELFGERRALVRPRPGTRGALAVLQALAGTPQAGPPAEAEPLSLALQRIGRLARGGAQVLVISDGASMDPEAVPRLAALRRQSRVGLLVVADVLEQALAPAGSYAVAWQGRVQRLDLHSRQARVRFRDALAQGPQRMQEAASGLGLPCRHIDTTVEPFEAVADLLGITWGRSGQ